MSSSRNSIPKLSQVFKPTEFAQAYRDLDAKRYIGRLAPSLGMIIDTLLFGRTGLISIEFYDYRTFLGITHLSKPMVKALGTVNKSLQTGHGAVILALTQEMGFGKTHFLSLLYHLYTRVPFEWMNLVSSPEFEDIVSILTYPGKGAYKRDIAEKTLVFAIDLKHRPEFIPPYELVFETASRILKKYNKLKEDPELPEFLKKLGNLTPKKAAEELAKRLEALAITIPILILVDELYASAFESIQARDKELMDSLCKLANFLVSLIDEVSAYCPVVLVYASAKQDLGKWDDLIKLRERLSEDRPEAIPLITMVEHLRDRASRKIAEVEQMGVEEAIEIVKKRLLRRVPEKIDPFRDSVCKTLSIKMERRFGEEAANVYRKELEYTYPFVPSFYKFASKLLVATTEGDFPHSQHMRDLLRLSSAMISKTEEEGVWGEIALVPISGISHDELAHLLGEILAEQWRQFHDPCVEAIKMFEDKTVSFLAQRMFSLIYYKSLTANLIKIIDIIRSPEALPKEDLLTSATSAQELFSLLLGTVSDELLLKFEEAREALADQTPYVLPVEREGEPYLIVSLVANPREFIDSLRREELSRIIKGDSEDLKRMINYLKRHLESFQLRSRLAEYSSKQGRPNLQLVDVENLLEEERPNVTNVMGNKFTILLTSPWSAAEHWSDFSNKTLQSSILEVLNKQLERNLLKYPNMLAVVVFQTDVESLKKLCRYIAEVKAADKATKYFQVVPSSVSTQMERIIPRSILDQIYKIKEEQERIVAELMQSLRSRLEGFAQRYTNRAVKDYVEELISAFRYVIYYDPIEGDFVKSELVIQSPSVTDFDSLYKELQMGIDSSVRRICGIKGEAGLRAEIQERILKSLVIQNKKSLLKGEKITEELTPPIDAIKRGWGEIPIKPLSDADLRKSLRAAFRVDLPEGVKVEVSAKLVLRDEREVWLIELSPLIIIPPPPPPRERIKCVRLVCNGEDLPNALLLLHIAEEKIPLNVVDLTIELVGEGQIMFLDVSPEDLKPLFGERPLKELAQRLGNAISSLTRVILRVELRIPMFRDKLEEILKIEGINVDLCTYEYISEN